jgi:biopolymer transport protein ExbB/TolQ
MFAAVTTHSIDDAIFHVASALQVPVLILALLALALVIVELGAFCVELRRRRGRSFTMLVSGATQARTDILAGHRDRAATDVKDIVRGPAMAQTVQLIVGRAQTDGSDHLLNKALADFDLDAQKRLGRTRMLVRAGPALGLMGTLIPLSPALTGLANGNTSALSHDLRVAFSVTVVGLLIGAVAFALSLTRDRLYSQDLSDLQYLAAVVNDPAGVPPVSAPFPVPSPR